MNDTVALEKRLDYLRMEHAKIDEHIDRMGDDMDDFSKHKLKKERLALRDQIYQLEQMIYPDIIA